MKRSAAVLLVVLVSIGLAAPAFAAEVNVSDGDDGNVIVLNGRVTVPANETVTNAITVNGPIDVAGTVTESVFAVNGDVRVTGKVQEDVTALNGRATIASGARVDGDVNSRFDPVVESGAIVAGSEGVIDVSTAGDVASIIGAGVLWLAVSVSTLVLGLLFLWLAPRAADAAIAAARSALGPALGWGVLLSIGLPVVALVLLLTIVGAPLGIGMLMALGLIFSIGYVSGALLLGNAIFKGGRSQMIAFLAGWAILRLIAVIPWVGGLGWAVASVVGVGALMVAWWRAHSAERSATPKASEPRTSGVGQPGPAPA